MYWLFAFTALANSFQEGDTPPPQEPAVVEQNATQPPLGQMPPELLEAATSAAHLPLPDRMKAISDAMLDRPYVSDPLGEGTGLDADPLARYDVYDCLTFTEEVLALSLAGDPADAAWIRNSLRYGDGPRDYVHRRHFMELQWIPENIAAGWLIDTTAEYGETVELEREVTSEIWANWAGRAKFAHADDQLPTGVMRLSVLPLEAALAAHEQIRPGSIILTVREDRSWKPIWISHVGFVIPSDERPTMRHTTKMGTGKSRDHSLKWYLEHIGTYANWKTLGIAVLEPVDFGPRSYLGD